MHNHEQIINFSLPMWIWVRTTLDDNLLFLTLTTPGIWILRSMRTSAPGRGPSYQSCQLRRRKLQKRTGEQFWTTNILYLLRIFRGTIQEPKTVSDMNNAEIAFSLFDQNRDGYITTKEMIKKSKNLTPNQVDKVFEKFDTDGDGRLSFSEFKRMMDRHVQK